MYAFTRVPLTLIRNRTYLTIQCKQSMSNYIFNPSVVSHKYSISIALQSLARIYQTVGTWFKHSLVLRLTTNYRLQVPRILAIKIPRRNNSTRVFPSALIFPSLGNFSHPWLAWKRVETSRERRDLRREKKKNLNSRGDFDDATSGYRVRESRAAARARDRVERVHACG